MKKEYTISVFEIEDIKNSIRLIEKELDDIKNKLKIVTEVR
jgi:hypothetical protein